MAKIVCEQLTISINRLASDDEQLPTVLTSEIEETLKSVVENIIDEPAVVEVQANQSEA